MSQRKQVTHFCIFIWFLRIFETLCGNIVQTMKIQYCFMKLQLSNLAQRNFKSYMLAILYLLHF